MMEKEKKNFEKEIEFLQKNLKFEKEKNDSLEKEFKIFKEEQIQKIEELETFKNDFFEKKLNFFENHNKSKMNNLKMK